MTNHTELDKVIDALLAEQGLASELRTAPDVKAPPDHWLRQSMKTGPIELPAPTR